MPSRARALVLTQLAGVRLYAFSLSEASDTGEAAVAAARAAGARDQEADAEITLGIARTYLGDTEAGLERLQAGLSIALGAGENATALRGYVNLSDALAMSGRYEDAAESAREGMALAARLGQTHGFGAYLRGNLVEPLLRLGRWDEADRRARRRPGGRAGGHLPRLAAHAARGARRAARRARAGAG